MNWNSVQTLELDIFENTQRKVTGIYRSFIPICAASITRVFCETNPVQIISFPARINAANLLEWHCTPRAHTYIEDKSQQSAFDSKFRFNFLFVSKKSTIEVNIDLKLTVRLKVTTTWRIVCCRVHLKYFFLFNLLHYLIRLDLVFLVIHCLISPANFARCKVFQCLYIQEFLNNNFLCLFKSIIWILDLWIDVLICIFPSANIFYSK